MREVINYIEDRRSSYESHDLFKLLTDESLPGETRLSWAPSIIPFIMGYSDLNKYVFRKGEGDAHLDPLQAMLNAHTYEEDFHWQWMLTDLAKIGADSQLSLSDATRVLWSSAFQHSRRLVLELASIASTSPTYAVFAMVEAIEAVSITIFKHCRGITMRNGEECEFFGSTHYNAETSHSIKSPEIEETRLPILEPAQRAEAKAMVDRVFALYDNWSQALVAFAVENASATHLATYERMVHASKEAWPEEALVGALAGVGDSLILVEH